MGRGVSEACRYIVPGGVMMGYFPFFTDVEKLHGVIIGGGHVALEKMEKLLTFGAKLTVVASDICDGIKRYNNILTLIEEDYKGDFLEDADYVIAATDDHLLNERIYTDAKARKLMVNAVDQPDICDFIFPSVIQRGRLVVGVSSSGAGPQVAIRLREKIEEIVPDNIEEILDYLAKERIWARDNIEDAAKRRRYLIELANKTFEDGI